MRPQSTTSAALAAAALTTLANAHSWVEEAYRIAADGTLTGEPGYARGWVARDSKDPVWQDSIPQLLLPLKGQSAYSGDEVLNKYDFAAEPKFPMLQAAPGDHVALIHLENGHTTLPQNQPLKPLNRGTIFFYGTADPKPKERLFDVHLVWNRDGTGGDKRGRLLATRNYDDGQCYQPNPGELSKQRAEAHAADGAVHDRELRCQSDIQLPADLKPDSTYTVYWYWDWPNLNADQIKMDATKDGKFPWAGTFMRGEKDPNGFTMAAIALNESYASTVDIKIVDAAKLPGSGKAAAGGGSANIYSKAIPAQMTNNFIVDIDANGGGPATPRTPAAPAPPAPPPSSGAAPPPSGAAPPPPSGTAPPPPPSSGAAPPAGAGPTVTVTVTVPPSTVTVTQTKPASDGVAPAPVLPSATGGSASPSSPTTNIECDEEPSAPPSSPSTPAVHATVTSPSAPPATGSGSAPPSPPATGSGSAAPSPPATDSACDEGPSSTPSKPAVHATVTTGAATASSGPTPSAVHGRAWRRDWRLGH